MAAPPPPYAAAIQHMSVCSKCRMDVEPGTKFCSGCGTPALAPRAFEAYVPPTAPQGVRRAMEHAECVVCFDPMHQHPSGVFTKGGKRVCPHFLHHKCALDVKNSRGAEATCPVCRAACDNVLEVPSLASEPRKWFKVVDLNQDHRLSQQEVLAVLNAQLPVDYMKLQEELPGLFVAWDTNGDGTVSEEELLRPADGLVDYVRREFSDFKNKKAIPDIRTDKNAWFAFFDEDGSGALDQEEVVRGVVQTFKLSSDLDRVRMLREILGAVWLEFDHDGGGTVDKKEFLAPGIGLADTLIATMGYA